MRSSIKYPAGWQPGTGKSTPYKGKLYTRGCHRRIVSAFALALALSTAFSVIVPDTAEARRSFTHISRKPQKDDPLTIVISLNQQRLKVFDSRGLVGQTSISSGRRGYETPTGIFTILQKNRRHYSNLYYGAAMPNMQRLTWSGVALHAGHLPGYPASHGCIRLPYGFSRSLFSMTQIGTRVIVHDDMIEPRRFNHTKLFAALPPGVTNVPHPMRRADAVAARTKAAGLSTVSAMLGVTPTAAAEAAIEIAAHSEDDARTSPQHPDTTTPPAVRTRATALAELEAAIDTKATIISDREKLHGEAAAAVAGVKKRLNEARADLRLSRTAVPSLKRDVKRKDRDVAEAERELERFIDRQQREMRRAETRAEKREQQHRADAQSDLETDILLKRAQARKEEADRDAAAREEAANEETRLEAQYLEAIHDLEAAREIERAQNTVITNRAHKLKAIEAELIEVRKVYNEIHTALDLARDEYKRAVVAVQHFAKPATVFISRRTGMLKIRQGNAEVYATPVKVTFPEARVGTHVFTAMDYADSSQTELKWQAMTLTDPAPELPRRPRRVASESANISPALPPAPTAYNALERFDIPEEARQRISELVKPGSALIISDDRASPETGRHTDFIVQPRI